MIRAHFHDIDLVIETDFFLLRSSGSCTQLELSNFSVTTSGDKTWNKGHVLGDLHGIVTETTVFETKGLAFPVGIPVIMGLIMSVVLVERVIQVTVNPIELRNMSKEVGHLRIIIWCVVVPCSDWIKCLVGI